MLEFTCTKKTNKEAAHMSILTQIVQESIEKLLSLDISEGLGVFLEKGQKAAFELLCKLASCRMNEMDNCIFEHPEARTDWVVVQKDRERTICTEVGEIQYRRRYYQNRKKVYIHGDGANWIKAGLNIIPNTVPILDTFHLMKQLRRICHGKYNIVICDYI